MRNETYRGGLIPEAPALVPRRKGLIAELKEGEELAPVTDLLDLRPSFPWTPSVMMFIGRRGCGKTLLMTALSAMYKRINPGRRVISNFSLRHADNGRDDPNAAFGGSPYLLDDLLDGHWEIARGALMCIDELTTAFPSSYVGSRAFRTFSRIIEQIRKLECEVLFTTQFPQHAARGLLYQTSYFVKCHKIMREKQLAGLRLEIWDWWGQDTGKDYLKGWPPQYDYIDGTVNVWGVHQYFGDYRTDDIIAPLWDDAARDRLIASQYHDAPADDPGLEALGLDVPGPLPRAELRTLDEVLDVAENPLDVRHFLSWAQSVSDVRSLEQLRGELRDREYRIVHEGGREWAYSPNDDPPRV